MNVSFRKTGLLLTASLAILSGCAPYAPTLNREDIAKGNLPLKTLKLHYDFMVKAGPGGHSHEPSPETIEMVREAFLRHGIDMQLEGQAIPERAVLTFGVPAPACNGTDDVASLYDLRRDALGDDVETRYAVFGHYLECSKGPNCNHCPVSPLTGAKPAFGATGVAEQSGRNLAVTFGFQVDFLHPITDVMAAGTMMHELGHTLGLKHGGVDQLNRKPNLMSVMNYSYQFGIPVSDVEGSVEIKGYRVDYSDRILPELNESQLDERVGLQGGHSLDIAAYSCLSGTVQMKAPMNGPVDWNCDGVISDSPVEADINGDGIELTTLAGADEWEQVSSAIDQEK